MSPARFLPALALGAALVAPLAAGAQTVPGYTPVRLPAPVFSNPNGVNYPNGNYPNGVNRSVAYPNGRPGLAGTHESLFLRTVQGLNLNPGQRQQVQNLIAQRRAENAQFPRGSEQRRSNNRRMREQITGLLSPQQRSVFEQRLHAARQQRRATRGGGRVNRNF